MNWALPPLHEGSLEITFTVPPSISVSAIKYKMPGRKLISNQINKFKVTIVRYTYNWTHKNVE